MSLRSILAAAAAATLLTVSAFAADVSGKWTGEMQGRNGSRPVTLELKADGSNLTGSMSGAQGRQSEIKDGKVDGDNVSFVVVNNFNGNEMKMMYKGKVAGDELKLSVTREGADQTREVTLKRAK